MSNKKSLKVMAILLIIFIVFSGVAAYGYYTLNEKNKEKEAEIASLQAEIESTKQFVYVATKPLVKGTVLTLNDNVTVQNEVTALPLSLYISEEDFGKVLVVDVEAYQPIMKDMVIDEPFANDTREVEIGVANLMLDQQVCDYVDLRILFPDGSSYLVIPKMKMTNLSLENNIFYAALTEDEVITLDSATIDAYTVSGTYLYITRYVQPNMQEEAIPNYPVRQETLNLMATDPNILKRAQQTLNAEAREALEARLALLSEDQLSAVVQGFGLVDTAHASAYLSQSQQNASAYQVENENMDAGVNGEAVAGE